MTTNMDGRLRCNLHPGLAVIIIKKEHQRLGLGTQGIIKDILTSAAVHPRGIKVRLESGDVGRVQYIEDASTPT